MRPWIVAALLLMLTAAAAASQPVAKLQLSCESRYQILSPTGDQLAAQCKDGVHLVSVPQGSEQGTIPNERGPNTMAYSPDGRFLAIGFNDGTVDVISAHDKRAATHWKADAHRIDNLYFFPDSKHLFVGPVDSSGTVWDISSDAPTPRAAIPVEFGGIPACAVSPDGKLLVAAGDDTVLRWYDTATWQKTREYRDFLLETFALTFTRDGKQLLAGGADARITVFDVASGKQVRQSQPESGSSVGSLDMLGDQPQVVAVYFDDAGNKPPHAILWSLTTDTSTPIKSDTQPSCGGIVKGNLWLCVADGKTLTISQHE